DVALPKCGGLGWLMSVRSRSGCDFTYQALGAEVAVAITEGVVFTKCAALTAGFGIIGCGSLAASAGGMLYRALDGDSATNPFALSEVATDAALGAVTTGISYRVSRPATSNARTASPATPNTAARFGDELPTQTHHFAPNTTGMSLPVHSPGSLTNAQARAFYLEGERGIAALNEGMIAQGVPARGRALELIQTRNGLRTHARSLMADRQAAELLNLTDPHRTL